jgi:hypothetical protein
VLAIKTLCYYYLHHKHVGQIAAGVTHSMAVTRDGVVFSWGSAEFGKLGHGPLPDVNQTGALMTTHAGRWWPFCPTPMIVNGLRGRPIAKVACGESHSLAATIDGELLAWGLCCHGRLGIDGLSDEQAAANLGKINGQEQIITPTTDGKNMQVNLPVAVDNLPWGHVQMAASSAYSLLLYSDLDSVDQGTSFGQRMVPEVVGHMEAMLESAELADVVLIGARGLQVKGHAVILLSVPYLCTAIRELRHKRMDDTEPMTVELPECEQDAIRCSLRFAYSGVYEPPPAVRQTLDLLQCAGDTFSKRKLYSEFFYLCAGALIYVLVH